MVMRLCWRRSCRLFRGSPPAGHAPCLPLRPHRRKSPPMDMPARQRPADGQLTLARTLAVGTATEGSGVTTVPASVYTDPVRFAAGKAKLFGRLPQGNPASVLLPQ